MNISEGYKQAARAIIKDAYPFGYSFEELFESMIVEYLLRENGRLGLMRGEDQYVEPSKGRIKK